MYPADQGSQRFVRSSPASASVAIVTDVASDVPAAERGSVVPWKVVHETWRGGGGMLRPDAGEHSRDLVRLVLGPAGMHVLSPEPSDFARVYEELAGVEVVFSIHASDRTTPAIVAAREAARAHENVVVIEVASAGLGVGLLAARARDLAAAGRSIDEITHYLRTHAGRVRILIVPDRFDPAGGQRLSAARLLAGRPLLSAQDGSVARSRRLRSRRATVEAIERTLRQGTPDDRPFPIAVGHGDAAGALDPFLDVVERLRPNAQVELAGRVGPRLVQHLDARCVGVAWVIEEEGTPEVPSWPHPDAESVG